MDCDGEPTGEFGDAHTLNVWSTVESGAPVLLWVHGGANTAGSSAKPEYAGDVLASHGIVFVSCNYRLRRRSGQRHGGRPRSEVRRWVSSPS